jgi:hypothetical protein
MMQPWIALRASGYKFREGGTGCGRTWLHRLIGISRRPKVVRRSMGVTAMDGWFGCFLRTPHRMPPEGSGEQFNGRDMFLVGVATMFGFAVASVALAHLFF